MAVQASIYRMPAELTYHVCEYLAFTDVVAFQGAATGWFGDLVFDYMMNRAMKSAVLPLHAFVRAQRVDCIAHLGSLGTDINARDQYGQTALHIAAERGVVAVVQALLLFEGVNKDIKDSHFNTPLSIAIWKRHLAVIQLLLENGAQHRKALGLAVKTGYLDLVKMLLRMDCIDVNETDTADGSPLLSAVKYRRAIIFSELLLRKDINTELRDRRGLWTPFLLAASRGQTSILLHLLSHGNVNVHASNSEERTALSLAAEAGYVPIVVLLLDLGVDPHRVDRLGRTCMHYAVQQEHLQVVQTLLQSGCDCQLPDNTGMTPIRLAIKTKNNTMVDLMLQYTVAPDYRALLLDAAEYNNIWAAGKALNHVDPNIRYKETVPLLKATKPGFVRFLLADARIDPNQADQFGKTILIHAVCNAWSRVVRDLVAKKGLNVDHVDHNGQTAMDYANNLEYAKERTKTLILCPLHDYPLKQQQLHDTWAT